MAGQGQDSSEVMTARQVAALLHVSPKTVYDLVQRRQIPGWRRVGRQIRFHRDVVLQWLRRGGVDPDPGSDA
jgi:excisionase family DNA binding protein